VSDLPEHLYIDTAEALEQLCTLLRQRPYIAIDTEFVRERTYAPELCLVQIKHQELLACIDTPAIQDLSSLKQLLLDPEVTKVFHAGSQDLEIFYLMCKEVPKPIFDTQIAAPLLGSNEQIGYANLVNECLGVELAKTHTRADWARRPLPKTQIAYALDDVIYLEQLYLHLRQELSTLKRLDWVTSKWLVSAGKKFVISNATRDPHLPSSSIWPAGAKSKHVKSTNRATGY